MRYEIFTTFQGRIGLAELVGEVDCHPLYLKFKILYHNLARIEIPGARRRVPLHPGCKYVAIESRWATDEDYKRCNGSEKPKEDFIKNF